MKKFEELTFTDNLWWVQGKYLRLPGLRGIQQLSLPKGSPTKMDIMTESNEVLRVKRSATRFPETTNPENIYSMEQVVYFTSEQEAIKYAQETNAHLFNYRIREAIDVLHASYNRFVEVTGLSFIGQTNLKKVGKVADSLKSLIIPVPGDLDNETK